MKTFFIPPQFWILLCILILSGCQNKEPSNSASFKLIDLQAGDIALCGSSAFGEVSFSLSCNYETREDFNLGISLLHSFEHDEAEKVFAKVIEKDPECPMAYWGVAMSKFHTVWRPPTNYQLKTGHAAITYARSLKNKTEKQADFIEATAKLYTDWNNLDHIERTSRFASEMEKVYLKYPQDKEAAIFYSYSLLAAADISDKTYKNQLKAADILKELYPSQPNHPGIAHYIIHSYDYPGLAHLALDAARKYASIAPASAHAQHMPSHIFTRLGLWQESIQSNIQATDAAKCYAEQLDMVGNWDEEVHGTDYLGYAYLQVGDIARAEELLNYFNSIEKINRVGRKSAYPSAAIPARFYLETRRWDEVAKLLMKSEDYPPEKFPWANGIIHFARILGALNTNDIAAAKQDFEQLTTCHNYLLEDIHEENNEYLANQVLIMLKATEAWIQFYEGKTDQALATMTLSAQLEGKTEKHPVTPSEVYSAQELLGDLLLAMNRPVDALEAYELNLKLRPNRFNGLYGAAVAAKKLGEQEKATMYFEELLKLAEGVDSDRVELDEAREYLIEI